MSVVSITSTRMLMAHGFLRRLFEVFERWKTPVDVVTTSEVTSRSPWTTPRRCPSIVEALSEFADVESSTTWPSCAWSAKACRTTRADRHACCTSVGDVPIRLVSQAASRRNVTFVIREPICRTRSAGCTSTFFAPDPAPASVAGTRG